MVGQHSSANKGGVAPARPLHISSNEFAAFMAPEGVEQPMNLLRSRILARHMHTMLEGGATLVTVYLEPGMRASGLNLRLLEALAVCCSCFDGPWIAMGGRKHGAARAVPSWLASTQSTARFFFATSRVACGRGAGAVLDYFVVSAAIAHLVQLSHYPTLASQTRTQSHFLRSQGLGTTTTEASPDGGACGTTETGGAFRMDLGGRGNSRRSGCERPWLSGAASTICAELNPGLSWAGVKGLSSSTFPAQATRKDTNKKAAAWRAPRRIVAQAAGNLAAWRKGRTKLHTSQRSVHTVASVSLPLGTRLGVSITGGTGRHSVQGGCQRELDGFGQAGHPFHQMPHSARCQCFGG